METDASHLGLGAVLSQEQEGRRVVIAYASRRLRPPERQYSSMKLEMLALKWAVTTKFRADLYGGEFVIYTDNNPLKYLKTAKLGAIEQRWAAELAPFNFTIEYRAGRSNGNADALSRQQLDYEPGATDFDEEDDVQQICATYASCTLLPRELRQQIEKNDRVRQEFQVEVEEIHDEPTVIPVSIPVPAPRRSGRMRKKVVRFEEVDTQVPTSAPRRCNVIPEPCVGDQLTPIMTSLFVAMARSGVVFSGSINRDG